MKFASVNTVCASTNTLWSFELKRVLKLAGWPIVNSSDGTTFNGAGDQITHAGSGAGGLANNRAHFTAREPGGRREWSFQNVGLAGSWQQRVKYAALARFVGGSATVTPTASDQQVLCGSGTDAAPVGIYMANSSSFRAHAVAYSTPIGGVYPFCLWATNTPGNTLAALFMGQEPMAPGSYDPLDVDPCIVSAGTYGGPTSMSGWLGYGTGSQTWQAMTSGVGPFGGTLPTDIVSGKDCNGRPYWTANVSGLRVKGYGSTFLAKGPSRTYPETVNRTTDAYTYASSWVLPFADNTEPLV